MFSIYEELAKLEVAGVPCALVTVIRTSGSTPRKEGAKMIVKEDGSIVGSVGGGAFEKKIIEDALLALQEGTPRTVQYHLTYDLEMCCGGSAEAFIEPLVPAQKLFIFGAGHIGSALTKIGKLLGFHVTVVDDRPEFANAERLPDAGHIIGKRYDEAFADLHFDEKTYIVVVTHDHQYDKEVLEYCATQPFAYLGMIGSKRKAKRGLDYLRSRGARPEQIAKIHTPMGLDIGAQTPEEIAVSIAAEIIAVKYGLEPKVASMKIDYASMLKKES